MASSPSTDISVSAEPRRPPKMKPRRKSTVDSTIPSPGSVRINFQGAFIVDEERSTSSSSGDDGVYQNQNHSTQGIRLPNHKAVVSHVALDASVFLPFCFPRSIPGFGRGGLWVERRTDESRDQHRLEDHWPN